MLSRWVPSAGPLDTAVFMAVRELPDSPSGGYAPAVVPCPANRPALREASGLSPQEASWLPQRRNATVQPMTELLQRAAIPSFDAQSYISSVAGNLSTLPNIAIAVSGGGYRAMLNGAGFIAAADDRTPGATDKGGIGGLLQASTYLAGLSGGGWLVGSIYANNFSSVVTLRDGSNGSSVWQLGNSIVEGPEESGLSILNTAEYWGEVEDAVSRKSDAGFSTTITDYWGRTLSYQLINASEGGPSYTFSSVADMDDFKQGQIPFPIFVTDERAPNTTVVALNATVFEVNPFELGSWDPTVYGFVPTQYLGSNFSNGTVPSDGQCVEGFDQAGYIMGTSSSLFNEILLSNLSGTADVPSLVLTAITDIAQSLSDDDLDIAKYTPNPFQGWRPGSNPSANDSQLTLVDGGEDLENIPLWPLIQPVRGVDVIFAVDSSADTTTFWPNATALRASYDRSQSPMANGTLFPPVPDADTFINQGLNYRPAFFGCDASNFTLSSGQSVPPLLVYVPNAPYTYQSNTSTFDMTYPDAQRDDIIRNGLNAATQGNATLDKDWPVCVACAILSRSLSRTGTAVPAACTDCFTRYCWNGTLDQAAVGTYEPAFRIGNNTTVASTSSAPARRVAGLAAVVAVAALSVLL